MKLLVSFVCCLFASSIMASPIVDVDVYGVDKKQAEEIKRRYGQQVRSIEFALKNAIATALQKTIASKTLHLDVKLPHGYNQLKKKSSSTAGTN